MSAVGSNPESIYIICGCSTALTTAQPGYTRQYSNHSNYLCEAETNNLSAGAGVVLNGFFKLEPRKSAGASITSECMGI